VAVALGLTLLLTPWLYPTVTPLFFVAVMISAWLGGWESGLLATVLSTLAISYFFIEPLYSLQVINIGTVVRLSLLAIAAGLVSCLSQSQRRALERLGASYQKLKETMEREEAARTKGSQTEDALRQSEARFRVVAANLPQGAVFMVDRNLRYLLAEGKALEEAGMTSEDFVGKTIWEALAPSLANYYEPYFRQALNGEPFSHEHYSHDHHYISHGTPLVNDRGEIYAVLAMSYDITDRKRVEDERARAEEAVAADLRDTQLLRELAARSVRESNVQTLYQDLISAALAITHAQAGTIQLLDPATQELVMLAMQNFTPAMFEHFSRIDARSNTSCGMALRSGERAFVDFDVPESEDPNGFCRVHIEAGYLSAQSTPLLTRSGRVIGMISTHWRDRHRPSERELRFLDLLARQAADLIEQRQFEQALRQSEADFRTLADNISQFAWAADVTGWIFWYNRRWFDYTGTTLEEMQGWGWQKVHHPDHVDRVVGHFRHCIETGEPWEDTFPLRGKDGTYRWFLSRAILIRDEQGQILRWFGTNTDVTDLKQAELEIQKFASLADNSTDFIGMCDLNFVPFYVNEAGRKMVGLEDVQQYSETPVREFFFPEDQDFIINEFFPRVLQVGQAEVEIRFRHFKTDEAVWMIYNVFYLQDVNSQRIGLATVSRNITERKQVETARLRLAEEREQLLQREQAAREAAETANRIKDEFLAVLSHELRSPLNPILGWAKLLQTGKLDAAKTTQAIMTIERNAKLQSELIEDLLDVSRILQGKLSLNASSVDLAATIRGALETVRLAAEAKSIAVEANLDSEVGQVAGDSIRLQQVVWNLLSNAVKFTPAGGRVEVRLERVDHQAQITVSDNGKGMSANFLPYVFDYFRQEDGATTRQFGGLGLGLAIVRHLVELHGGTVEVVSAGEGLGATFTVKLPQMKRHEDVEGSSSVENPPFTPSSTLPLTGLQILVIDDETDSREFVAFVLEQAGASVTTAATASAGFLAFTLSPPDVLISDIGMPDMDGYMLMRQVRKLPPEQGGKVKAIALTAYAGEGNQQQALHTGFQQHLAKPVEPDTLVQAIAKLLRHNP
jgi:PAS domain S-box-containing protein